MIQIEIQGEPFEVGKSEMTPDEIIQTYQPSDLSDGLRYLAQIKGKRTISYRGKGHKPIRLRGGMKFMIFFLGPCTNS